MQIILYICIRQTILHAKANALNVWLLHVNMSDIQYIKYKTYIKHSK